MMCVIQTVPPPPNRFPESALPFFLNVLDLSMSTLFARWTYSDDPPIAYVYSPVKSQLVTCETRAPVDANTHSPTVAIHA